MEKEIKQWLKSQQDYNKGLTLLQKYSKNRMLTQFLVKKKRPRKLAYELAKIARTSPVKAKPKPEQTEKNQGVDSQAESQIQVLNKKQVKYEDLPPEIKSVYDETVAAYKKQRSLHEKLKVMEEQGADDAHKQPIAQEIADLDKKIRENWEKIDNWEPAEKEQPQEISYKRISANRKYISINKEKINQDPDKWLPKIQERYDELKNAQVDIKPELVDKLKSLGVNV